MFSRLDTTWRLFLTRWYLLEERVLFAQRGAALGEALRELGAAAGVVVEDAFDRGHASPHVQTGAENDRTEHERAGDLGEQHRAAAVLQQSCQRRFVLPSHLERDDLEIRGRRRDRLCE